MAQAVQQRGRTYPPAPGVERVWPAQVTAFVAIALQITLPNRLTAGPPWLLPSLETALVILLVISTRRIRLEENHPRRRALAIVMIALVSAANVLSLYLLTHYLLHNNVSNGRELIGAGVLIWLTNFLIFSLWYWELDRGGPGVRAAGRDRAPDFLFPQMADDRIEPMDWRPHFVDYLYVSLTNAAAFSPTDTMPLTPMAKGVMGAQSLVSLVTIGLIVSRAINIL
jgi:uncharacterized membrane protein